MTYISKYFIEQEDRLSGKEEVAEKKASDIRDTNLKAIDAERDRIEKANETLDKEKERIDMERERKEVKNEKEES
jgi:hypothetical protein